MNLLQYPLTRIGTLLTWGPLYPKNMSSHLIPRKTDTSEYWALLLSHTNKFSWRATTREGFRDEKRYLEMKSGFFSSREVQLSDCHATVVFVMPDSFSISHFIIKAKAVSGKHLPPPLYSSLANCCVCDSNLSSTQPGQ